MRTNRILQFFTLMMCAIAFAFVTGCEGPTGPAGPNGTNGTDGLNGINGVDANETCKICHNDDTDVLVAKGDQFEEGKHSNGTYYDRDGECSACHNTEGFLAREGFTDEWTEIQAFAGAESAISCYTCHSIHEAYDADDWNLTYATQVTKSFFGQLSPDYEPISFKDYESANLCLQCHQARDRGDVPGATSTAGLTISSSHWGPHYGVQGSVLHSSGGVNLSGNLNYPTEGLGHAGAVADVSCTDCHMYNGNHNLEVNFDACTSCHADTDWDDQVEAFQKGIHDKMFELGALLTTQGMMTEDIESSVIVGYEPKTGAVATAEQAKGVYNYMVVYQDHSKGVHNAKYMEALLQNSIDANTP